MLFVLLSSFFDTVFKVIDSIYFTIDLLLCYYSLAFLYIASEVGRGICIFNTFPFYFQEIIVLCMIIVLSSKIPGLFRSYTFGPTLTICRCVRRPCNTQSTSACVSSIRKIIPYLIFYLKNTELRSISPLFSY